MLNVPDALARVTDLFSTMPIEWVPLREAPNRILAQDVAAVRAQPPFAASAMDGYAVRGADAATDAKLTVVGESAAGTGFADQIGPGECVRIFTGAPLPQGADRVVIQENVDRTENVITLFDDPGTATHIRAKGADFQAGDTVKAPLRLGPNDIALLAAMNCGRVPVYKHPEIALLATGDELVMPGENPGSDQIITSNNFGLAALFEGLGARVRILPIARDTPQSLAQAFRLCDGADMIVTLGGASVGDHDIVHSVATDLGLETAFYKVAMRPGKPLMAGKLNGIPMIGLPGNPVSAMVCGHIFLRPALNMMLGLGGHALPRELAQSSVDMPKNGPREHYMRADLGIEYSRLTVHPKSRQDSALLSVLARSNALLVRPPNDPARHAGDLVEVIRL